MRDAGRCSQERGMEGTEVDVDLPLAFQAQRMPQSAKKITEHRSGAVAAATNTNGNPKSVYFCSCRCCCCRFLGFAALCCILQIQFKYKVSSLFFVFSPLSPDRQTDKQTASIWFKSLMWLLWWWWRLSLSLTHSPSLSLCLCSCCLWPCGKILKARAKCVNVWEEKFRWQVVTLPRLAVLN